ncbi:MAG: acylphosphatase [Actinomycetota bacterium]|nr:acylphosphatase [Actinomycetota bacterium]
MSVRQRVVVAGRVQGVFFRDTCRTEARRAGLSGSVANRPDGRVEAVFEGDEDAVGRLVAWCRRGPPDAQVDGVEVSEEAPTGEAGFHIR